MCPSRPWYPVTLSRHPPLLPALSLINKRGHGSPNPGSLVGYRGRGLDWGDVCLCLSEAGERMWLQEVARPLGDPSSPCTLVLLQVPTPCWGMGEPSAGPLTLPLRTGRESTPACPGLGAHPRALQGGILGQPDGPHLSADSRQGRQVCVQREQTPSRTVTELRCWREQQSPGLARHFLGTDTRDSLRKPGFPQVVQRAGEP